MKKYAWTLAEMFIALTILIMLSGICVNVYRPTTQKARLYAYSAIRNLTKGNIAVMEKSGSINKESVTTINETDYDWYCMQLADVFNLETAPNCLTTATAGDINLQFANGVTIQGLASPWVAPYEGATFFFKNIVIDIDGSQGLNKVWADRFPMRIIAGSGKGTEGLIVPAHCLSGTETMDGNNVDASAANPYCKNGFTPTGSVANVNLMNDNNIISYNIYKATSSASNAKAELIASNLSFKDADCMAFGSATGFFNVNDCKAASIKIDDKCATTTNCATCDAQTCPTNCSDVATVNPEDISCITMLHKPSSGMSFFIQSIIGDADDLVQ